MHSTASVVVCGLRGLLLKRADVGNLVGRTTLLEKTVIIPGSYWSPELECIENFC
jgi:hypothetical protein